MDKLVVILGPTASGKTNLAVNLASKFQGEIISADSRQIYRGMDIGTGKDLDEYKLETTTIPYHLIDILDSKKDYSVFQFKNDFYAIYNQLLKKNKTPILCGGTGLYIESILLNYNMPNTGPSSKLRNSLEVFSIKELSNILQKFDATAYDPEFHITKRRLIRSIEIIHPDNKNVNNQLIDKKIENALIIGIKIERNKLLSKIKTRLNIRLQNGLIEEVESFIKKGMTLERLSYFGLEYKFLGQYLFDVLEYDEMVIKLNTAINRFSKKQMTFFRRMEKRGIKIHWIDFDSIDEATHLVSNYV